MKNLSTALGIFLFFVIVCLCSAGDKDNQNMDKKLASAAELVLRVERLAPGEGSKYLWYEVRVIEVLVNPAKKRLNV